MAGGRYAQELAQLADAERPRQLIEARGDSGLEGGQLLLDADILCGPVTDNTAGARNPGMISPGQHSHCFLQQHAVRRVPPAACGTASVPDQPDTYNVPSAGFPVWRMRRPEIRVGTIRRNCSLSPPGHGSTPASKAAARSGPESTWCGALDQNAPAPSRGEVEVVDLKADLVLGVRYPGAEVFVKRAVLRSAENDGSLMQLVINWEHRHAGSAGISDPADAARRSSSSGPR